MQVRNCLYQNPKLRGAIQGREAKEEEAEGCNKEAAREWGYPICYMHDRQDQNFRNTLVKHQDKRNT